MAFRVSSYGNPIRNPRRERGASFGTVRDVVGGLDCSCRFAFLFVFVCFVEVGIEYVRA